MSTTFDDPAGPLRPWASPRCHGCRELIAANGQLRTLSFHDEVGSEHHFQFLFCGSCGSAFAVERLKSN